MSRLALFCHSPASGPFHSSIFDRIRRPASQLKIGRTARESKTTRSNVPTHIHSMPDGVAAHNQSLLSPTTAKSTSLAGAGYQSQPPPSRCGSYRATSNEFDAREEGRGEQGRGPRAPLQSIKHLGRAGRGNVNRLWCTPRIQRPRPSRRPSFGIFPRDQRRTCICIASLSGTYLAFFPSQNGNRRNDLAR